MKKIKKINKAFEWAAKDENPYLGLMGMMDMDKIDKVKLREIIQLYAYTGSPGFDDRLADARYKKFMNWFLDLGTVVATLSFELSAHTKDAELAKYADVEDEISIAKAAKYTGKSQHIIRSKIREGILPESNTTGKNMTRVKKSDLDKIFFDVKPELPE